MVGWTVSICGKRYDELSTWTSPDIKRFASLHCGFYCCQINYESRILGRFNVKNNDLEKCHAVSKYNSCSPYRNYYPKVG